MATVEEIDARDASTIDKNVRSYVVRRGGGGTQPPVDPIDQEIGELRRDSVRRTRLSIAEAESEAIRLKLENDLAEEKARQEDIADDRRARRQQRHGVQYVDQQGQPSQGPGSAMGSMESVLTLVTATQKSNMELITTMFGQQNASLKEQLEATRAQMASLIARPPEDPVKTIDQVLGVYQKLQSLAPHPAETAPSTVSAVEGTIRLEESRNKMELERLQFRYDMARDDTEKQRIAGEIQARQFRDWQLAQALKDSLPQLTAALTARITGTSWNPQMPPAPPGVDTPPPGTPAGWKDWECGNCHQVNWGPPELTEAQCPRCGTRVRLIDETGAPPPPPATMGPPAPPAQPQPEAPGPPPAPPAPPA